MRFKFSRFDIEIHPSTITSDISSTDTTANSISPDLTYSSTVSANEFISYYILIILFALCIGVITTVIIFRRRARHLKQVRIANAQKKRELDAKTRANLEKKPDLLSSTVGMLKNIYDIPIKVFLWFFVSKR